MLLAHLYYREFPNHLHKIKYKMAMDTKRQHTWKVNGRIKLFIAPCFVFAFPALILLTLLPIHQIPIHFVLLKVPEPKPIRSNPQAIESSSSESTISIILLPPIDTKLI